MKTVAATLVLLALLTSGLFGCAEEELAEAPSPARLDRTAIGYYCSMIVADHVGPKAHIFLRGQSEPYWFSSVRDAVAFTKLPGEPKTIVAIYVNDMGRGSWEEPDPESWVEARGAWFVVGSDARGGMGAPETVPFAERQAAEAFADARGGAVMAFADIPEGAVLGPVPPDRRGARGHDAGAPASGAHGAHASKAGTP